jgi:hypothetical protein
MKNLVLIINRESRGMAQGRKQKNYSKGTLFGNSPFWAA